MPEPVSLSPGTAEESQKLLGTVAKGSAITFIGSIIGKLLFFLTQVLIVWVFGLISFGLLTIGIRLLQLSRILASIGLPKGGMRFASVAIGAEQKERVPGIIGVSLLVPVVLSIPIVVLLIVFNDFVSIHLLRTPEIRPYLKYFAVAVPFAALTYVAIDLTRAFRTTKYAAFIENIVVPVGRLFFITVLVLFFANFHAVAGAVALAYALAAVVGVASMFKLLRGLFAADWHLPDIVRSACRPTEFKALVGYSFPLFLTGCLSLLLSSTDILMLGYFRASREVGIYGAAVAVASLFSMLLIRSVDSIFAPMIATEHGRGRGEAMALIYQATTRWMFYLALPLTAAVMLGRNPIMMVYGQGRLVLGAWVLFTLSIGHMINCVSGSVGYMLSMTGHQNKELGINVLAVVLNIVLNLWFIQAYGIVGAAVATTLSQIIVNGLRVWIVYRIFHTQPLTPRILKLILGWAVVVVGGTLLQVQFDLLIVDIALAATAPVLILLLLVALGLEKDDKRLMNGLKDKILKHHKHRIQ